jgi:ribosomal peptide maturation radical SAM protein 1
MTGLSDAIKHLIDDAIDILFSSSNANVSDIILVVPPFASPDRPSLGLHIISNIAEENGLKCCVLYSNLSFARVIGPGLYRELCHMPTEDLVGERLFETAHRGGKGGIVPQSWIKLSKAEQVDFHHIQAIASFWSNQFGQRIGGLKAKYVGFSTVFEQTLSSLSIMAAVKKYSPSKCTLLGGANTDGPMGAGLAEFDCSADFIFTGESEESFAKFLLTHKVDPSSLPRIITGSINVNLNELAIPQYLDYFTQFDATVHENVCNEGINYREIRLPYESSRGCWWGEKHHCTFCGLNANGMSHRIKDPSKVALEIENMSNIYNIERILMVDNIMPYGYFSTLLPKLISLEKKLSIFYEQKANISLEKMAKLKLSGINSIQPGIESLSTKLLKLMRKGSTAQINIDCLRFGRSSGVEIVWNLLCDFPGDENDAYLDMLRLVPMLHHLQPPGGLGALSIDRFSPYHSDALNYGITKLTPLFAYSQLFPSGDIESIAYHFRGEYESAVRRAPQLHLLLSNAIDVWIGHWANDSVPMLGLFQLDGGRTLLIDTRSCSVETSRLIDEHEMSLLLHGTAHMSTKVIEALDRGQLVEVDNRYSAIACAPNPSQMWTLR